MASRALVVSLAWSRALLALALGGRLSRVRMHLLLAVSALIAIVPEG